MPQNISPQGSIQPLSIGNVVSAGLRIYRSHFKSYLGLALQGSLWAMLPFLLLIPLFIVAVYFKANPLARLAIVTIVIPLFIYGWAKYYAFSAIISRLAFCELVNEPESVTNASNRINSHFWSFFWLNIRITLRLWLLVFLWAVLVGVTSSILLRMLLIGDSNTIALFSLLIIIITLITFLVTMRLFSRWMIAEVLLAVEKKVNIGKSIDRSWILSKNQVSRIQAIVFIGCLINLPIFIVSNFLSSLLMIGVKTDSPQYWVMNIISVIIGLLLGVLTLPFWQAIKAVLCYDLRSRREGLGLKLRDREV